MNELNLNLLVAIVARAMKEGFTVSTYYDSRINIQNKEDKFIELTLLTKNNNSDNYVTSINNSDNYVISILSDRGKNEIENVSEEDVLRFKLLVKDCERYEKSKLIEDINSFFVTEEKKEETKKTINDLDNEDD
jgi:hypothetical protein